MPVKFSAAHAAAQPGVIARFLSTSRAYLGISLTARPRSIKPGTASGPYEYAGEFVDACAPWPEAWKLTWKLTRKFTGDCTKNSARSCA